MTALSAAAGAASPPLPPSIPPPPPPMPSPGINNHQVPRTPTTAKKLPTSLAIDKSRMQQQQQQQQPSTSSQGRGRIESLNMLNPAKPVNASTPLSPMSVDKMANKVADESNPTSTTITNVYQNNNRYQQNDEEDENEVDRQYDVEDVIDPDYEFMRILYENYPREELNSTLDNMLASLKDKLRNVSREEIRRLVIHAIESKRAAQMNNQAQSSNRNNSTGDKQSTVTTPPVPVGQVSADFQRKLHLFNHQSANQNQQPVNLNMESSAELHAHYSRSNSNNGVKSAPSSSQTNAKKKNFNYGPNLAQETPQEKREYMNKNFNIDSNLPQRLNFGQVI